MGALCKVGYSLEIIEIITQNRYSHGDWFTHGGYRYEIGCFGYYRTHIYPNKNYDKLDWYGKIPPPKNISDHSYQTINLLKDRDLQDRSSQFRVGDQAKRRQKQNNQKRSLQGESMRQLVQRNKNAL